MMLNIEQNPKGPRLRFMNKRIHHGFTGIVAITVGAILCAHDKNDWRVWFKFNS